MATVAIVAVDSIRRLYGEGKIVIGDIRPDGHRLTPFTKAL